MAEHAQDAISPMYGEAPSQITEMAALHHNPWNDVDPSEHSLKHHPHQNHDPDHELSACSALPPIFTNADNIDADIFNANLSAFFSEWILATIRIFNNIGPCIVTCEFWASQIRTELDHRLWQKDFLGREATEEELDWLVDHAMRIYWPRIQELLRD
jgi:hypothetical protein